MPVVLAMVPFVILFRLARSTTLRISGNETAVRTGAARALFEGAAVRVGGIRLTEIIEFGDDLLLGYRPVDAVELAGLASVKDGPPIPGQMLLPGLLRDQRSMLLLQRWRARGVTLTSCISHDGSLVGLVDGAARTAVVARVCCT